MWLEEEQEDAELLWCPPCEELQMLQRSEAKPPNTGVVRPQFLLARKTDGSAGGEFRPRET